jgi:hypothetical protein
MGEESEFEEQSFKINVGSDVPVSEKQGITYQEPSLSREQLGIVHEEAIRLRKAARLLRGVGVIILTAVMLLLVFGGYVFFQAAHLTSTDRAAATQAPQTRPEKQSGGNADSKNLQRQSEPARAAQQPATPTPAADGKPQ